MEDLSQRNDEGILGGREEEKRYKTLLKRSVQRSGGVSRQEVGPDLSLRLMH